MTVSADCQGGVISSLSLSLVMQEEDAFTEELLEDVEGRIRDFFLGCFTKTEQEDSFESVVRDGKLYGQDYDNIKVVHDSFQYLGLKFTNCVSPGEMSEVWSAVH